MSVLVTHNRSDGTVVLNLSEQSALSSGRVFRTRRHPRHNSPSKPTRSDGALSNFQDVTPGILQWVCGLAADDVRRWCKVQFLSGSQEDKRSALLVFQVLSHSYQIVAIWFRAKGMAFVLFYQLSEMLTIIVSTLCAFWGQYATYIFPCMNSSLTSVTLGRWRWCFKISNEDKIAFFEYSSLPAEF